ncbi:MAG: hypothetical protein ACREN2_02740 [Candidatus Dormibacteria bacterium]
MPVRTWLKQTLPPNTVDSLRTVRHASAQALAGADLWQLRLDLERRIEDRLRETEAVHDERIMAAIREELAAELDRWSEDLMDRMDILLGASNRLVASFGERVTELERRLAALTEDGANGHATAETTVAASLGRLGA